MEEAVYIHPKALVETDTIGARTRVWAFAHVMKGAEIGSDCNICDHSFVESTVKIGNLVTVKNGVAIWEKVTVEDGVFLGPYCVFTNDMNPRAEVKKGPAGLIPTRICRGASIGANATIVCGITIGRYAFIGAGAVVTKDVPDFAMVYGNPAGIHGYMCACGEKIETFGKPCPKCGRIYKKDGEKVVCAEGCQAK
ncbi:dTDP-3-amino-3,6-dideoxy-alpha-D-galactopyranose 3-N-acetyltransferase [bacterium BMS3Abin05]|nr:dTDP-3-amino-3,6-dideoxy-alpha-D-galactopyranose 3-N-acetyltransferase [bacterium BMS3Abin05]GBE26882.1 dTDP-3-amino-3,6-dideoxy-alpha-D-galactopyranose 3-N-acetyltransferase [bacterium BMS3Bbin03]